MNTGNKLLLSVFVSIIGLILAKHGSFVGAIIEYISIVITVIFLIMRANHSTSNRIVKNRSYYESVLDLSGHHSRTELRKTYLEKTMLYHPDKVNALGSKLRLSAEEEMKDINAAYSELQKYCTS